MRNRLAFRLFALLLCTTIFSYTAAPRILGDDGDIEMKAMGVPLLADTATCSICFSELSGSSDLVTRLACFHSFHEACILRWLQEKSVCPVCQNPVEANCWVTTDSPLHKAIMAGLDDEVERLLIDENINVNAMRNGGGTLLHDACSCVPPHYKIIKCLLDKGADPTVQDETNNLTPMDYIQNGLRHELVSISNDRRIVSLLQERGATLSCGDRVCMCCLHPVGCIAVRISIIVTIGMVYYLLYILMH